MIGIANFFLLQLIYFFNVSLFINSFSVVQNSNIKISIIVPVYNVENYLHQSLESIINQSYKNIEIICINDGSTDNSLMILKEYEKKDKRIKVISQNNKGLAATKNVGMKVATGDYITFVDSDDFIDLNVYEKCIESIIKYKPDIVIYQILFENSKDQRIIESKIYINDSLSAINNFKVFPSSCNKVFKKTLLENVYFIEDIKYAEDLLFRDMIFPKAKIIVLVPKISYHYRNIRIGSLENTLKTKTKINALLKGAKYLFNYYKQNKYYEFMEYIFEKWIRNIYNSIKSLKKTDSKYIYSIQVLDFFDLSLKNYINVPLSENRKNIINYFKEIKMKGPKISVILPFNNNNEKYIIKFLNNILNQSFEDLEIICVKYGNTNDSIDILNEYTKIDKRLVIVYENIKEIGEARNLGILLAKGEYLSFLDINNFFENNFFKELIDEIDITHSDILIYRYEIYNQTSDLFYIDNYSYEVIWPYKFINYTFLPNNLFDIFGLFIWNKLFKLSFIKNNQIFFNNNSESCLLFMDLSMIKTNKISLLDKTLIFYNKSLNDNIENKKDILGYFDDLIKLKVILKRENIFNILSESYNHHIQNVYIKTINQSKYNKYLHQEIKKEKYKEFRDVINVIDLTNNEEKNIENIIKNTNDLFEAKISVIIPIYNSKDYLEDCLNSILSQTLKEIEIICINDGSTDNSLEIIQHIVDKDYRVKIINQTNKGPSEVRNIGIKYARGEYIFFMDSDDYLDKNSLLELYYTAKQNNLDILYFEAEQFNNSKNLNNQNIESSKKQNNNKKKIYKGIYLFIKMEKKKYNISPCLQIIKKEFYEKNKFKFYPGILFEGRLFFITSILQAERTSYINKAFYKMRIHSNSMTKNKLNIIELYSYLIIYCEIQKLTEKLFFIENAQKFILKDIKKLENDILRIYSNIKEDAIKSKLNKKLTIYQKIQLNKILQIKTIQNIENNLSNIKSYLSHIKLISLLITCLLIYYI